MTEALVTFLPRLLIRSQVIICSPMYLTVSAAASGSKVGNRDGFRGRVPRLGEKQIVVVVCICIAALSM